MDKFGRLLGWGGLIGGGAVSVAANIRSLWLPAHAGDTAAWRTMEQHAPSDPGAFVLAVFLPLAALVGVEMVNHWTHLHRVLRYGVLGMVTASAMITSFVHIVTVLMWYGQPTILAILATLSVDGLLILSGLALFARTDTDNEPDTVDVDTVMDRMVDMRGLSSPEPEPVLSSPEPEPEPVLSSPEPEPEPVLSGPEPVPDIPRPRTPARQPGWKLDAQRIIRENPGLSDREVAAKIGNWDMETEKGREAGRRAVARVREKMAETA